MARDDLYKNRARINHTTSDEWEGEFFPQTLVESIANVSDSDANEHEGGPGGWQLRE